MFGVADTHVKERLLHEFDLTLTKALDICHAAEASKVQLKIMSGTTFLPPADVQSQLSGKTIFMVVDMKDGHWHVKLSDESLYYCTFNTLLGRKRFLRMHFGISSASEVMQKRNRETFGDISGVHVIADDLIVAADTEQEHDVILH